MRPMYCRNNAAPAASAESHSTLAGWLRLAACTAAVGVLWLGVLPWIAARPDVRRRIEFLEQRQIDPSAMFYTELEAMDGVRDRMAELRRQHPSCFWQPGREPEPSHPQIPK